MAFTRRVETAMLAGQTGVEVALGPLSRLPAAGQVDVYATSTTTGDVELTLTLGTDIVADRAMLAIEAVAGQGPIIPNNLVASGNGRANDPIIVRLDNIDGVATPTVAVLIAIS